MVLGEECDVIQPVLNWSELRSQVRWHMPVVLVFGR